MKNQRQHVSHQVGLILALVGLMIGVTLMPGAARVGTAQTVAPSWSHTGNLNTARSGHTATLLRNGKVLVVGGYSAELYDRYSAELYDPGTGVWSNTGRLNIARGGHTTTLLPNGKVLVAGGATNSALNSAELYDEDTGTWSFTGNLHTARYSHTATLLRSGKVLVAGGFDNLGDSKSAELYDPATGVWSSAGNFNEARSDHTATLLQNGKVLVAGGNNCGPQFDCFFDLVILNSAELYDPATGLWSVTGSLNVYYYFPLATLLPNGKVLVAGGATNSAELYDLVTGTWSNTGNLISYRAQNTATLLPNGKVLVAAGWGGGLNTSNTSELYDTVSGTWSLSANLNNSRVGHAATLLTNGKVLVAGGVNNYLSSTQYDVLNSAELYDLGTSSTPNPIDDAQFFVRQHYLDFLNREPDIGGLAFWTNNIASCGFDRHCIDVKRIDTSAAFFLSIEFQETGYLVYRTYKASFGDLPNTPVPIRFNEFLPDTLSLSQGVIVNQTGWEQILESNKQNFFAQFVQRSRFTTAFPTSLTPTQFVDTLFANAGVVPSSADRAEAISEFGAAATSSDSDARARALRRIAENSTFAQQEFNRAFVLMQYFGYLRRNPTTHRTLISEDSPSG